MPPPSRRSRSAVDSRPPGLILLVAYKTLTSMVLLLGSIGLGYASVRYRVLSEYALASHRVIVVWVLRHLTEIPRHTLEFSAIATILYASLSGLEALGLWYERSWARWLVLVGVGASLPLEVFELVRSASLLKFLLLVANGLAFWYVLKRLPNHA